ncbi:hypothetical protein HY745_00720 [Candidatus Desantisbacteria bacterium]|nr:hypothetical protein [Candidatus Desantisbacteria bacterium]
MNSLTSELLREKGYISFIDVLIKMEKLSEENYEKWRFQKIPYLEKAINLNLNKINFLLRAFHKNSRNGGLRRSKTEYNSWGKGIKVNLRFSKYGNPNIEEAYSTHFVKLI